MLDVYIAIGIMFAVWTQNTKTPSKASFSFKSLIEISVFAGDFLKQEQPLNFNQQQILL